MILLRQKRYSKTSIVMPPVDFEIFEERLDDLPENKYKALPPNLPLPDRKHIEARMKEWKIKNWRGVTIDLLISKDDNCWIGYIVDKDKWFYREGRGNKIDGLDKDYDSLFDLYKDLLSIKEIKNQDIRKIINNK